MDYINEEFELSEALKEIVNELIEDYPPDIVAGLLMANAFTIYGRIMSKDDYKDFMADMFKHSDQFSDVRYKMVH